MNSLFTFGNHIVKYCTDMCVLFLQCSFIVYDVYSAVVLEYTILYSSNILLYHFILMYYAVWQIQYFKWHDSNLARLSDILQIYVYVYIQVRILKASAHFSTSWQTFKFDLPTLDKFHVICKVYLSLLNFV